MDLVHMLVIEHWRLKKKPDRHKSRAQGNQRRTDGWTDQPTDRPTKRLIESRARD